VKQNNIVIIVVSYLQGVLFFVVVEWTENKVERLARYRLYQSYIGHLATTTTKNLAMTLTTTTTTIISP